jgi:hypothetical protein
VKYTPEWILRDLHRSLVKQEPRTPPAFELHIDRTKRDLDDHKIK